MTEPLKITTRYEFPQLIDAMGLKRGAEIGVATGEYSAHLLSHSGLELLYSIDAWMFDAKKTRSVYKRWATNDKTMEQNREACIKRLEPFGQRSYIINGLSEDVVRDFVPDSLDFIYIDASHRFSGVALDLVYWWDVLRVGGVFAGDDYWLKYRCEVVHAVNAFMVEKEQHFHITTEEREYPMYPPSWWCIKTSMTKAQYFDGLPQNRAELQAAKARLMQKKVRIALPYEYCYADDPTKTWEEV